MNGYNIAHDCAHTQETVEGTEIVPTDYIGMMFEKLTGNQHVFCPMCEEWHENNTWCQENLNAMYHPATEGFNDAI